MSEPCGCHGADQPCGCCAGVDPQTPADTFNPPGQPALRYRIGTHASFLETMQARLATLALPDGNGARPLAALTARTGDDPAIALLDAWATVADVLTFYQERIANEGYLRTATERGSILELARLVGYSVRPGVAASVYLAYELEQPQPAAVLPGQPPRSTEQRALEQPAEVLIPAGSRAQSTPGPGELPQPYETSEPLIARATWNNLRPRMSRPQNLEQALADGRGTIYFNGIATNLKPNDPLLISLPGAPQLFRVLAVAPDNTTQITAVALERWEKDTSGSARAALIRNVAAKYSDPKDSGVNPGSKTATTVVAILEKLQRDPEGQIDEGLRTLRAQLAMVRGQLERGLTQFAALHSWISAVVDALENAAGQRSFDRESSAGSNDQPRPLGLRLSGLIRRLEKPPTLPPPSRASLARTARRVFTASSDSSARVLSALRPSISRTLYAGWRNLPVTPAATVEVYALRVRASVFGHNAPQRASATEGNPVVYTEWRPTVRDPDSGSDDDEGPAITNAANDPQVQPIEVVSEVTLDAPYGQVLPQTWIVLDRPAVTEAKARLVITQAADVAERSRADYGISAKAAQVRLAEQWLDTSTDNISGNAMRLIRGTAIYTGSEKLELADVPIDQVVADDAIELGDLYDGLDAGRWLIVAGERADLPGVAGVRAAELVMLAGVRQDYDPELPGDRSRTTLLLATPLAYSYTRSSVIVYGNVAHATHGETRPEVLGSGDGSRPLQQWTLHQPPLTFVSAPSVDGAETTLQVFVNDVRWHEAPSLFELGATDRRYITRTDDDQRTSLIFGNGEHGAHVPTGRENVRAVYRTGIGQAGNVAGGSITLLATRPLGVKGVINPLPASGGADRESRDQARENAPLGVTALDRLVSVQDYEDFARTFAGIGKAGAREMSDGQREIVHLTIAGANDIPIALTSDLYKNLRQALHLWGDPQLPLVVAVRELVVLIISANVRIHPDYVWEKIEPQLRAALLHRFGFERRRLGEDALLSAAVAAMQAIEGVEYVDVDLWGGVPEQLFDPASGRVRTPTPEQISAQIRRLEREQRPPNGPPPRVPIHMARMEGGANRAAQIGVLLPTAPDTLLLRRLP